jgi:acyl-CoA thioesterase-1
MGYLASPDRQIVMFELPLPPFCNQYGRIQRTLAQRHQVKLIPKRIFLSIIAGDGSTLDSIHLSQTGHQKMADCVWGIIEPAFASL